MKRWNLVFGLVTCAIVLALASPALAGPITLRLESGGGATATVIDNAVGDLNPTVGVVTFSGSLGDFSVNVTTGLSNPAIGDPFTAMLDLNSVDVAMSAGGSLKITLQNDDFAFPFVAPGGFGRATAEVGGVLTGSPGSSVSFQSWVNTGNLTPLPGSPTVIPAGSTPVFGALPVEFGPGAFASTQSADFVLGPEAFSLFSQAIITMAQGGGLVSFDEELTVVTPEPGTLVLFGSCAALSARLLRRRREEGTRA